MNVMFDRLSDERDAIVAVRQKTIEAATDEGRELSPAEVSDMEDAKKRIAEIDLRIGVLADDLSQEVEIAAKVRKIGSKSPEDFAYRNAGEAMYDMLHQSDPESKRRFSMQMRAAEHMGTTAAATTPTAGDLGGLVIAPSVGAIVDPYPSGMPFLNWLGWSRIPSAAFSRPYIDDPDFATGVAEQSKQKAELVSKKFTVNSETLSPVTYGGYLNISQQLISLQPGSLQIIINHLRRRLAWQLELAAINEVAATTGKETLAADADAAATLKAIYAAAAKVMTSSHEAASFMLMGPLGFAQLGSLADAAGRPLFPFIGAANAPGQSTANTFTTSVAGMHAIITPAITGTEIYVGNRSLLEAWYFPLPLLEVVEPSVLGRQVAVSAMLAPHRPSPFSNSIIKLAPSA